MNDEQNVSELHSGKRNLKYCLRKVHVYLTSPLYSLQWTISSKTDFEKFNDLVAVWKRNVQFTEIPKGKGGPRNNHFTVQLQYDVPLEKNIFVKQTTRSTATVYHVCHYC